LKRVRLQKFVLFLMVTGMLAAAAPFACGAASAETVVGSVEQAHRILWEKFIGANGVIHDFVGEIPTPADCKEGRPNAIGWWSPIENGPFFTGLYLAAACERARRSGEAVDKSNAAKLAQGLLLCASVSDVPGMIVRGTGTDGRCHYPLGSDDQTHPWFYGLHTYVKSGLPGDAERRRIIAEMQAVAGVLQSNGWRCPCDGAFKGQFRGGYTGHLFRDAVRYLYLLRAMYDVTGEPVWLERYQKALAEKPGHAEKSRLELCSEGYAADRSAIARIDESQLWIYVGCQGSLAKLIAMESDERVRSYYRRGLALNAANALKMIDVYRQFDNADTKVFGHANWRVGYPEWFPQKTQADALKMSRTKDSKKLGLRKNYEVRAMRNPLAVAVIIAMGGGTEGREAIERAICHYDYSKLNMAEFFFAECAWYALPDSCRACLSRQP